MFKGATALLSGSLIGKFIGLVRELLLAYFFGTSVPIGAYRIAQTATLILVNFFTADSLNAGFIPLYTIYKKENPEKALVFFWLLQFALIIFAFIITLLLIFGSMRWAAILAPGFNAPARIIAAHFLTIMALGVPFYLLGASYSYLAIANNSYVLASCRSSIQSMGLIAGTMSAFYCKNTAFLAWGFTGAYMIFALWGILFTWRQGFLRWPDNWLRSEIQAILKKFWMTIRPLLLLPIILQGNIAIARVVASFMGVVTVAGFDYAKYITDSGIILLAAPLGLVGLSSLSGLDVSVLKKKLIKILPLILCLTIPISAFLGFHGSLVVALLYQRGAFVAHSSHITSAILLGLSIGLWAQIIAYILIKVLNAQLRNREAIIIMAISLLVNIGVNLLFYKLLGPFVLGLSESLSGIVMLVMALRSLRITKEIAHYFYWMFFGVLAYLPLGLLFAKFSWANTFFAFTISTLFWLCYFLLVPCLRIYILSLLKFKRKAA